MRTRAALMSLVVLAVVGVGVSMAAEIPWGKDTPAATLPAVFKDRAKERLAAEEVARQDAYRKLIERVYGLALDAKTDVQDLALTSKTVDAALQNELRGMKDVETKYFDDGRVETAVKVTMREVVEIIEKTYKREEKDGRLDSDEKGGRLISKEKSGRLVTEETLENVRREKRDQEIIAVGRGALKDSPGLAKIRAMRAAEVDCYARLAARVFGIRITADTTVQDFVLERDSIKSKVAVSLLNGVKFTKYEFKDDGTCAATGQITIREVVEVLTRTYRRYAEGSKVKIEDIEKIQTKNHDLVLTEVGQGVVRGETVASPAATPFIEQKTVIERVLSHKIVVD